MMPISTSPSKAVSGARLERPGSGAPRPAASSCRRAFTTSLCTDWWIGRRRCESATVFIDVDPKMRIAQEEIFGPVVSVIPCDDLDGAIEIANGIEYGLSSSLYTKDVNKA